MSDGPQPLGLTLHNPRGTCPGFTLFSPLSADPGATWLVDMEGRLVHRWLLPGPVRAHAELLPNGYLLAGILVPEAALAMPVFGSGLVVELDWEGREVWRHQDLTLDTHDRERLRNGNTLVVCYRPLPKDVIPKLKGNLPHSDVLEWGETAGHGGVDRRERLAAEMSKYGEFSGWLTTILREITPQGEVVWEWWPHEHLDFDLDTVTGEGLKIYPGLINAVVEMPDGDIMFCSPEFDTIYIIDKGTGDVKWRWGRGIVSMPHDPTPLDNGNILVFNNNRKPTKWQVGSRVLEVNPRINKIEWEYRAPKRADFFTAYMGGAQRLANGNTLIASAMQGLVFEVTPAGEKVWQYEVPFFGEGVGQGDEVFGKSNAIFRAHRYGPEYPGLRGKTFHTAGLDLWNRLYGPRDYGFGLGLSRLLGRAPNGESLIPNLAAFI